MARYSNQRQYEFDEMHANDNDGEHARNFGNYNRGSRYEEDDMRYGSGRSSSDFRRGLGDDRDYSERYGRPETRNFDYDDEMNYGGRDRQDFGYGQSFGGDDYGSEYGSSSYRGSQGNFRGSRGYGQGGYGQSGYSGWDQGGGYSNQGMGGLGSQYGRGSYGSYESDYDDSMSSGGAYGGNAGRSGRQYSRSGYGDYSRGYGSDEDMNYGGSYGGGNYGSRQGQSYGGGRFGSQSGSYGEYRGDDDWDMQPRRSRNW